jgi:hypothetical protein
MKLEDCIVRITTPKQEEELHIYSQMVYDETDKDIRIDIGFNINEQMEGEYHHIDLNRKQAIKMVKLLNEFILWNNK